MKLSLSGHYAKAGLDFRPPRQLPEGPGTPYRGWRGPYPLAGTAGCGLVLNSLQGPCAPLLPVWRAGRARQSMPSPPCPFLSCPALHTDTHRALARAGSLLLRAVVGPTPARRYLPPCCLQHVPSAHARRLPPTTHVLSTCAARCRAKQTNNRVGRVGKNLRSCASRP